MKKLSLLIILAVIGLNINAQEGEGTITGYVYGPDSTTIKPFTPVWIDYNGDILGGKTDLNGKYKISAIKPGVYNLHAKLSMNGKATINGVNVGSEGMVRYNLYLSGNDTLPPVIVEGRNPLIQLDHIATMPLEMIENSPNIQNPKQMLVDMNSELSMNQNNQISVRGSRPGDVIYIVDGIKQNNLQSVPGVAIGSMAVYTGGIPAKYGDTTGGVVIMNTKSYFDLYYAWKASQE